MAFCDCLAVCSSDVMFDVCKDVSDQQMNQRHMRKQVKSGVHQGSCVGHTLNVLEATLMQSCKPIMRLLTKLSK